MVADEGYGYTDEGEEVLGFAFVAAVESSAAGQPRNRALDHPAVAAQPLWGLGALAGDAVADASTAEPSAQVGVFAALVAGRRRGPRQERMGGMPRTRG